jgi:hypothetical protein
MCHLHVCTVHLYLGPVTKVHLYLEPVNDEHLWYLLLKYCTPISGACYKCTPELEACL